MDALKTVQLYYQHFNNKNYQGMVELLDENLVHEPNQGEPRLGIPLFKEFLQLMEDCYDESLSEMVFYTEQNGDRIACEFLVNGVYKKADTGLPPAYGQTYVLPAASFLTVSEGKINRIATFYNLPLWIKLVS